MIFGNLNAFKWILALHPLDSGHRVVPTMCATNMKTQMNLTKASVARAEAAGRSVSAD
jgi:hypothetical protein